MLNLAVHSFPDATVIANLKYTCATNELVQPRHRPKRPRTLKDDFKRVGLQQSRPPSLRPVESLFNSDPDVNHQEPARAYAKPLELSTSRGLYKSDMRLPAPAAPVFDPRGHGQPAHSAVDPLCLVTFDESERPAQTAQESQQDAEFELWNEATLRTTGATRRRTAMLRLEKSSQGYDQCGIHEAAVDYIDELTIARYVQFPECAPAFLDLCFSLTPKGPSSSSSCHSSALSTLGRHFLYVFVEKALELALCRVDESVSPKRLRNKLMLFLQNITYSYVMKKYAEYQEAESAIERSKTMLALLTQSSKCFHSGQGGLVSLSSRNQSRNRLGPSSSSTRFTSAGHIEQPHGFGIITSSEDQAPDELVSGQPFGNTLHRAAATRGPGAAYLSEHLPKLVSPVAVKYSASTSRFGQTPVVSVPSVRPKQVRLTPGSSNKRPRNLFEDDSVGNSDSSMTCVLNTPGVSALTDRELDEILETAYGHCIYTCEADAVSLCHAVSHDVNVSTPIHLHCLSVNSCDWRLLAECTDSSGSSGSSTSSESSESSDSLLSCSTTDESAASVDDDDNYASAGTVVDNLQFLDTFAM
jgi:hypothetical protein